MKRARIDIPQDQLKQILAFEFEADLEGATVTGLKLWAGHAGVTFYVDSPKFPEVPKGATPPTLDSILHSTVEPLKTFKEG